MKSKKNKRVLFVTLLVVMLAVTSVFIGSFARYLQSRTVSDDAVVAKFGLDIPTTINLFSDSYTNVQADESGKKIIAPGTEGEYKFNVTGTSEVAYKVDANVLVEYSEEWDGYAPIEFSVNGDDWTTDLSEFQEALGEALASTTMAPNSTYSSTQTIYWKWPFYVSSENDALDTAMGSKASAGNAPSVSVDVEVTAAQVD